MILGTNPYLVMEGNTKEAVEFYKEVLDAKVVLFQTFGEMPAHPDFTLPDEAKDLVAHAHLKIGDTSLMFSDNFPGQSLEKGNHMQICITTNDTETSKTVFEALSDEGKVGMPLQETFWSPGYGEVTDKFGVKFVISTDPV